MIKSLKASNGSFAKLGNLQVQPTSGDLGQSVKQQSTVPSSIKSSGVLPAHEASIGSTTMSFVDGEIKVATDGSLISIASSLFNDKTFVVPPFHGNSNSIMPSFALQLEPSSIHVHVDGLASIAKKFEPYEQLTGISHERPEIVMLTNFLPLFMKDVSHSQHSFSQLVENGGIYPFMTDAGRFADTHLHARYLRNINVIHMLRGLRTNYLHMSHFFTHRKMSFEKSIDALRDNANFLLDLVRSLERLKAQLDLRDDIHTVDPQAVVKHHHLNFTKIPVTNTSHVLYDFARRYLPASYTVSDALVRMGYKSTNVRQHFSSTKIWLQLLLEMKDLLRFHSLEFLDVDPVGQRNDSNATNITRITSKHFSFNDQSTTLPTAETLAQTAPANLSAAINQVNQAWKKLYRDVHFKTDEAHIAGLINMISKEFRYSFGLGQADVQRALSDHFGFTQSSTGNSSLFDSVIGKFGDNIGDVPATQTNSLTNLAQHQATTDTTVLTFESKYIDGDTGTLTPGGTYYVDQVLKTNGQQFDTSRLDQIGNLFEKTHNQFNILVNGMNVLATRVHDPQNKTSTQFSSIVSSPVDLTNSVIKQLVNVGTGATLPAARNDNLGAIYAFAAKNDKVKSALFLYTVSKVLSTSTVLSTDDVESFFTNTNGPTTIALAERVINALTAEVPQTKSGTNLSSFVQHLTLTRETIRSAMRSGTNLTRLVESVMTEVIRVFKASGSQSGDILNLLNFNAGGGAMFNSRSRYGNVLDTNILMTAFDMILQMVVKYNNQQIVSTNSGYTNNLGTLTFVIARTSVNHKASVNDLITRIEKEVALTHKLVYAVMNTLHKLSSAFKNYSNYLKSPPAVDKLRDISRVIGDPGLLHMLMSEQQIMMMASTVHDLVDRISQTGVSSDNGDVDGDGDFDADDELKILDDSVMLPKLRNAVYGLFGTQEFASQQGYNKKVMTVGIPMGFTRRLKQRVSINNLKQSTLVDKQNDIVNVVVYKVDLQNSDIIYKPKKFPFELSRFPVRNDKHFLNIPERPTIDDIAHALPTRDFGQSQGQNTEVTYWSLNTDDINKGRKAAFADESYSFLSQRERAEIIRNHIKSYLLEVYTKMMTGISLADYHFDLVEPPKSADDVLIKMVTEHQVHHASSLLNVNKVSLPESQPPTGGVLFTASAKRNVGYTAASSMSPVAAVRPQMSNAAGIAGSVSHSSQFHTLETTPEIKTLEAQKAIGTLSSNLSGISHRNVPVMLHGLRTISNMAHMITPMSDPLAVSKRILSPKQFDRVFNVIVDPDEFEIDYDKTVKTPHGKQALHQMIQQGDIVPTTENHFAKTFSISRAAFAGLHVEPTGRPFVQNRAVQNHALYKYRDRNKGQGDLTFEKYFVTIETYGEDEV